jgi:hypothetical protein
MWLEVLAKRKDMIREKHKMIYKRLLGVDGLALAQG